MNASARALVVLDHAWRFEHVCDVAETYLQRPRAKLLGKTPWTVFPSVGPPLRARIIAAAKTPLPNASVVEVGQRRFEVHVSASVRQSMYVFREVLFDGEERSRVFVACPRMARSYFGLLESLTAMQFVETIEDAVLALALDDDIDALLTTVDFDESRALELLRYARQRHPTIQLACCKLPYHSARRAAASLHTTLAALRADLVDISSEQVPVRLLDAIRARGR